MLKQTIALFLFAVSVNAVIDWMDCGSHLAIVRRVRIEGCHSMPCTLTRGHSYEMECDASSLVNSYRLPFTSQASILGINVTLYSGNACDYFSRGACPARNGDDFTFKMIFDVPQVPPIRTNATTILYTDFGAVAICMIIELIFV